MSAGIGELIGPPIAPLARSARLLERDLGDLAEAGLAGVPDTTMPRSSPRAKTTG